MSPIFARLVQFYTLLENYELEQNYTKKFSDSLLAGKNLEEGVSQALTGLFLIRLKKWNKAMYY